MFVLRIFYFYAFYIIARNLSTYLPERAHSDNCAPPNKHVYLLQV